MTGDTSDMVSRLKLVLPAGWFANSTPFLDALLTGLSSAWSSLYTLLNNIKSQTRIASASGIFLDIASQDYFGKALLRRVGEADSAYSARIRTNLLRTRATRESLVETLNNLTGKEPVIFEPLNAQDTGGYNINAGYNVAGGYGSYNLPYQFFVTTYQPDNNPISQAGGYNLGPGGYGQAPMFYAQKSEFSGTVSDADIYAAIAAVLPTSAIAWTRISN